MFSLFACWNSDTAYSKYCSEDALQYTQHCSEEALSEPLKECVDDEHWKLDEGRTRHPAEFATGSPAESRQKEAMQPAAEAETEQKAVTEPATESETEQKVVMEPTTGAKSEQKEFQHDESMSTQTGESKLTAESMGAQTVVSAQEVQHQGDETNSRSEDHYETTPGSTKQRAPSKDDTLTRSDQPSAPSKSSTKKTEDGRSSSKSSRISTRKSSKESGGSKGSKERRPSKVISHEGAIGEEYPAGARRLSTRSSSKQSTEGTPRRTHRRRLSIVQMHERGPVEIGVQLVQAAEVGDAEKVYTLLQEGHATDTIDGEGRSALRTAAKFGHTELVQTLITQFGADVNDRNPFNLYTSLHWACKFNREETVKALISIRADCSIQDKDGCLPIEFLQKRNQTLAEWMASEIENIANNDMLPGDGLGDLEAAQGA